MILPKKYEKERKKCTLISPTSNPTIRLQHPRNEYNTLCKFHNGNPVCQLYTRRAIVANGPVGVCGSYLPMSLQKETNLNLTGQRLEGNY